jgi:hypothetical protein
MARGGTKVRPFVTLILVGVLLGVATTYASAWGLLNRAGPRPASPMSILSRHTDGWYVQVTSGSGWFICSSHILQPDGRGVLGRQRSQVPVWSLVNSFSPSEVAGGAAAAESAWDLQERAAGWPCLAIVERVLDGNADRSAGHEFTIRWPGSPRGPDISLAFMPMWSGFVVNTLVFAVCWAAVPYLVIAVVRRNRGRAGLCPKCRYDMCGLTSGVCPECGNAAPLWASKTLFSSA